MPIFKNEPIFREGFEDFLKNLFSQFDFRLFFQEMNEFEIP